MTALFFILSCVHDIQPEYREGFFKSQLQVYVSILISREDLGEAENASEQVKEKIIMAKIMQEAEARGAKILASHISLNVRKEAVSPKSDFIFNEAIAEALKTGKIKSLSCSENYLCKALIVFEASPVFNALQRVNAVNKHGE